MKIQLFLPFVLIMIGTFTTQAQIVTIPDATFKAYLVGHSGINTNSDTEIQVSEANAYTGGIYVDFMGISDLTGIEAFTSLQLLDCGYNNISALDVSNCTALHTLECKSNNLTSASLDMSNCVDLFYINITNNNLTTIDVSIFPDLMWLMVGRNQISSIDVTSNPELLQLNVNNNLFTSLNLSGNPLLYSLYCQHNQLSTLSLSSFGALTTLNCDNNNLTSLKIRNGNNTNFGTFRAINNPNLTCIEVDNASYSNANWPNKDPWASYSIGCNAISNPGGPGPSPMLAYDNNQIDPDKGFKTTSVSDILDANLEVQLFPNPTQGNITIDLGNTYEEVHVEVKNALGQVVTTINHTATQRLDMNLDLVTGLYLVTVRTESGEKTIKLVKE